LALIVAIGAGAVSGGVGGGGGAGFFLWHPATISIAAKPAATTRDVRFIFSTFLSSFKERFGGFLPGHMQVTIPPRIKINHSFPAPVGHRVAAATVGQLLLV
jgi:hypothetical protein